MILNMRVAVEYAGRWYGHATIPWLENHHTNIITSSPSCIFDIFIALIKDQICVKTAFSAEDVRKIASSVFRSSEVKNVGEIHVQYTETAHNASRLSKLMKKIVQHPSHASSWKTTNMISWYKQYWNIAMCEYMRRQSVHSHDLILRIRVDTLLKTPENLEAFRNIGKDHMYFVRKPQGYSRKGSFKAYANLTYWCERMWITRPLGMDFILNFVRKTSLVYDPTCSLRCCGFCSEEQTENQLIRANAPLKTLHWDTYLVRMDPTAFQNVSFVSNSNCKLVPAEASKQKASFIGKTRSIEQRARWTVGSDL